MLVHGAFWLLFLALLVFGAVTLVRRPRSSDRGSALDILNERSGSVYGQSYAKIVEVIRREAQSLFDLK